MCSARTHLGDLNFTPTPEVPALQYLESVDKGSSADKSRLLAGDFLLEVRDMSLPLGYRYPAGWFCFSSSVAVPDTFSLPLASTGMLVVVVVSVVSQAVVVY